MSRQMQMEVQILPMIHRQQAAVLIEGTDEQKENTADSTGSAMNSDTSDVNASDTGSSDTDKKTSDNAAQAPVEGTVTQDTETKRNR